MMSIKDKVAVIGVGCSRFGENFDLSYEDMIVEATYEAYQDAGIDPKDIQAAWLGTVNPEVGSCSGKSGGSLADPLRLFDIPITRVENYCASGLDAFRNGCMAVASGMYDIALVVGAEKMRDSPPNDTLVASVWHHSHPLLNKGMSYIGFFGMSANKYREKYGLSDESLARVAVKSHHNGALNPRAFFQREIDVKTVTDSPMMAYPLRLLHCAPVTDGAAAAIITRKDLAKNFRNDSVLVKGLGLSVSTGFNINFNPDYDFLTFRSTQIAARQAYEQAGVKDPRKEISFAEVHDCFSITEILNYENLGFCQPGEGTRFIDEGVSTLEGDLPVNPSGGLKSFGHPIGATGVRMIYEITKQLQGKCGPRQVKNAKLGLAHNLGGTGIAVGVTILGN